MDEDEVQVIEKFLVRIASSCRAAYLAKTFEELRVLTWGRVERGLALF